MYFLHIDLFHYWLCLIKLQSCHHIETIQLIFRANQLTGFYMMATLAFNELSNFLQCFEVLKFYHWKRFSNNIVNKADTFFIPWKYNIIPCLYFEKCLRKEIEISVETNFGSFVFIYRSKCSFSLLSWKLFFTVLYLL